MKIPEKIAKDLKPGTAVVAYSVPTKTGAKHIQFSTAQVNQSEEEPLLPTGFAGGKEQADSVQTNQQEDEKLLPTGFEQKQDDIQTNQQEQEEEPLLPLGVTQKD